MKIYLCVAEFEEENDILKNLGLLRKKQRRTQWMQ